MFQFLTQFKTWVLFHRGDDCFPIYALNEDQYNYGNHLIRLFHHKNLNVSLLNSARTYVHIHSGENLQLKTAKIFFQNIYYQETKGTESSHMELEEDAKGFIDGLASSVKSVGKAVRMKY